MPNLKGLGLQNFRTFNNKENLEFSPITLITGTNNAGKSSVFKAIQFLVHNFKDGIVSETLDFKSMKHELGNLERIFNRVSMATFKNSKNIKSQSMYSRLSDFHREYDNKSRELELPIFEEDEDLVFAFPIKFGGSREISATLEVRYELNQFKHQEGDKEQSVVSHNIKSIAIVKDGKYLHWSNIIRYREEYQDDAAEWEMKTSIDLKKIIQLIIETPFIEIEEEIEPNKKTEDYFTIDLFSRIEKYKGVFFDFPFSKYKKDNYQDFTEKLIKGKSLFSDYSELTEEEEKSKLLALEQKVTAELLKGRDNSQFNILDCFKRNNFSGMFNGMERDIVRAELKKESPDEKKETSIKLNLSNLLIKTTPNSQLFTSLLEAIEKDFLDAIQKKINSLKKVYFLPTTRGRNREWFIDEQNSEDIQIVRDFSAIYLETHQQIKEFINFWIGKGETNELDENGEKKLKGFKIGKELSVYRDEAIGLTKIFLINFDDTKTPLVDLGYGISQLLPIIMKIAIIAQKHQLIHEYDWDDQDRFNEERTIYFSPSTLLIEEPEANLHPSLQSKMAELFIDAASRFNIQFLIETHSEYLIYKFQEYVGQKIISPSEIKMYYFNHPNDVREGVKDKYISHVQIGEDGSVDYDKYFGKGFFDEQTNLKLSLLNIQRDRFLHDFDELKKNKEEYENKITELEQKIDDYINKLDIQMYQTVINTRFDVSKISSISAKYLSSGQLLLNTIHELSDFSPVIIQYGRTIENELKEIFIAIGITDVKKLMLGKFQGSLEKYKTGTTTQSPFSNNELVQLPSEMSNRFENPQSLKIELLEEIRVGRNDSGHSGQTKTKQDAINYIEKVNEFLDKWILEKK
ncbi:MULTISPECIES: DUF3696 domain-containing protein [unclassified Arcicella]|uniref:AAA family ATPase n=1 Tax=unclassified Arcicella TaxID=2644986 RepID=UPI00285B9EB5|nr:MULTISPECIES: DUF3696 domain-containing protein [unclassified Arcicella]MDR6563749.1 putative ATPase [Arcicella sp. BE51]MDR6813567.1 putative ATPase [Arcicella sp. BE140]MDR6824879.1 putative ATPase [Arcicella sp. BE139]